MEQELITKFFDLSTRVQKLAEMQISENSKRAYFSDFKKFYGWCRKHNLESLPAEISTVALYLADLRSKKYSSISRAITSIGRIHQISDNKSPCDSDTIRCLLKGLRRELGICSEHVKPIMWKDILKMVEKEPKSFSGLRNRALISFGWASAMRRSEICAMNIEDIEIIEEGMIATIRRSKTDQEGSGHKIFIPKSRMKFCPVVAMTEYMSRMKTTSGPLFVRVSKKDGWFLDIEKKRLTSQAVTIIVKKMCRQIGLNPINYSAHSLRRGFATQCGRLAIPERLIARQTRHRSMEVLREYIDDGSIISESPLTIIYKCAGGELINQPPEESADRRLTDQADEFEDELHNDLQYECLGLNLDSAGFQKLVE